MYYYTPSKEQKALLQKLQFMERKIFVDMV